MQGKSMGWLFVAITCALELVWVYGFNVASSGWHWALIVLVIVVDFAALAKACQVLPTGTVYAVFAAVGTIGAAVLDVALFERTLSVGQGLFMGLLVLGVVALKLADEPASGGAA